MAVVAHRLGGGAAKAVAVLAVVLCAVVFWPGVVDQGDLDARPVNALAAFGVGLAFVLTVAGRRQAAAPRPPGDMLRLMLVLCTLIAAPPWIGAELGFYLDGVPLLGWLYRTGAPPHGVHVAAPALASVHHGHHHGMDGALLVCSALLLSRLLPTTRGAWRAVVAGYLSLMLAYGAGNIANDFWLEQVVKRGWTTWAIPNVLQPQVAWVWGVIVALALLVWLAVMTDGAPRPARSARRRP